MTSPEEFLYDKWKCWDFLVTKKCFSYKCFKDGYLEEPLFYDYLLVIYREEVDNSSSPAERLRIFYDHRRIFIIS